jgi:signal transduction histidine kinase
MATGQAAETESEGVQSDGTKYPIRIRAFPLPGTDGQPAGFIEVVENITRQKQAEAEQRRLEAQIQHTQKLESLGVLAGGIAHDFNNLLMGILGNAELAMISLPPMAPGRNRIEEIKKAGIRASELTKQMLAYSGRGKFVVEAINLNHLIEEMAHLLQVSISKKVAIQYHFSKQLPLIDADATQIRQVIMNLITNASDAIGDKNGVISLTTGVLQIDTPYLNTTYLSGELPNGPYVYVEVSDSGCGMDEATRARIFDPFFTTKFTGRGLGLAAVLGIMRGHQGAIKLYSEPGNGTTFKILFPCARSGAGVSASLDRLPEESWSASGTILVVDDEEVVRDVAQNMLETFGFQVLTAHNGQAGVELFRQQADEIVAVLLDMTMPQMNGDEAFREMRRIRPGIKVILTSGYNEQDATTHFSGKGLAGFVQKPFQLATLTELLRDILAD